MSLAFEVHYTVADYEHWQGKWELIEGIPVAMTPAPIIKHQEICTRIINELFNSLEACSQCRVIHEAQWYVADDIVLIPDGVVICYEPANYLDKRPELVIEVVSPSTARTDEHYKFDCYRQQGVKYYIIVYPEILLAKVYELKQGRYDKVDDFTTQIADFDIQGCKASIDFNKVFASYK